MSGHDPLLDLDPELLERHQQPGPRYTSYPTIPVWETGFDEARLRPHLSRADQERAGAPLSVYVHLPFCPHRCLYCGCASWESQDPRRTDRYLDALEREIGRWAELLPHRRTLAQLHLGGGTPNALNVGQLTRLHQMLTAWLQPLPGAQLALEANPATILDEQLELLGRLGFTRISFGVQDFTPEVQAAVERPGSVERTAELVALARRVGFTGVNLDVIYGLPRQQLATFRRSLETVAALNPDRVAVFGYAHVPWIHPHQRALESRALPDLRLRIELFREAYRVLVGAGYREIGLDHFARPQDELSVALDEGRLDRNFQGYTVNPAADLIGLGVTAISEVGGAYAQNEKDLEQYEAVAGSGRLTTVRGLSLDADDELRGHVIRRLMCNLRLSFAEVEQRFGVRVEQTLAAELATLAPYVAEGFLTIDAEGIVVAPRGRLIIRNLVMPFDRYLKQTPSEAGPRFSKTL